jgi:PEP-CTERM motif-containing protein
MTITKAATGILGALLFLTIVSSVRADVVHPQMDLEKLLYAENHQLAAIDVQGTEIGYLYVGHFENNNGKHLGFSLTAVNNSPKLGIVRPQTPSVSQNPEPTTMVLLATGLAGVTAFARKKRRSREL